MSEPRTTRTLRAIVATAVALSAVAALSPAAPGHATEPPPPDAVAIVPLTPARLLDTRSGLGAAAGKVGPDGVVELDVTGVGGVPADEVGAVVLNVTVTEPTAASFVTVWPTGTERPVASSLNMRPADTVPNLVIAKVGEGGTVSLFNRFGETHLVADVMAWIPEGVAYGALQPERLLDTRSGLGAPAGAVGPGGVVTLQVVGRGGVPQSGAGSVVLNVTATEPTAPSFVTVWPSGVGQPGTSSLNMVPGETVPNLVISRIGADGRVQLANRFGTTHLVADVVGWIPDAAGFTGITPERVLDTRGAGPGALGPDITRALRLAGTVPADATAVALNVTITEPTAATFITAWPAGVDRPTASSLNAVPGQTRPAMVIVKLGTDQTVNLFNRFGSSHLVADLVGWYATPTEVPLSLLIGHGLTPSASELEPGRPLAAMADGEGRAADFVANELIFVGPTATANEIAAAWHGTVAQSTDSLAGLDPVHVLRFDLAAIDTAALPDLASTLATLSATAEGAGSALQVSDADAAKLLQLQALLLADGHTVAINPLSEPAGYADGLILEEWFDMNKDGSVNSDESFNAFDWTYLREGGGMDHGFTSAWQQLDTYGRLRPAVEVAVFDGGFFDSDDLGPMTLVGTSYGSSNLASCTGGNPCPWHGTGVAGTIYGTHNNSIGTAGGATPVISEMVAIGVGRDIVDVLWGLLTIGPELYGSKALNISAGGRIPVIAYAPLYLVLAPIALGVNALGLQIVASAGNEGANVDDTDCFIVCWESGGWIPCELPGVICVGGLQLGTQGHAANSNYGNEDVDIWASYTVKIGPAPDQVDFRGDPDSTDRTVNGTSFSAPLVTAALALTAAAHPGMSGPDAGDLLIDTARAGSGRVKRILDVQAAVNDALTSSAPFVRLTNPPPGGSLVYGGEVTLKAAACCTTATFEWREGPRGGSLTTLATGQNPTLRLTRPPGLRTLEVRATFPGGAVKTERIDYTITNQAPSVTMYRPAANESFFQSQNVPLRGTSFDEAYSAGLPAANYTWRIDGAVVGTGPSVDVPAASLSVGSHSAQLTVTDGNLAGTAVRTFSVVADPPNPPPLVTITSPMSHTASTDIGTFVESSPGVWEYVFTATATSSDMAPDPTTPIVSWFWKEAGSATEHAIGTGSSVEVRLPTSSVSCAGIAWHVIARVSDGTTTTSDFIEVVYWPIC